MPRKPSTSKIAAKAMAAIVADPFRLPEFQECDINDITDEMKTDIMRQVREGFNYYNYNSDVKSAKKWFVKYITKNGYDKKTIQKVNSAKDWKIGMTMGALAKMLNDGLPALPEFVDKINDTVDRILSPDTDSSLIVQDDSTDTETPKRGVNVHEKMMEKIREFMGEYIEYELDKAEENEWNSDFKLAPILQQHEIPGKQSAIIANHYRRNIEEISIVLNSAFDESMDEDEIEQMKESYKYPKPVLRRMLALYEMIVTDATHHANKMKAGRKKRAKKKPSTQKLISKINYKKSDDQLNLVSVDPAKIIGASEVWLYNTKTRKLIRVRAGDKQYGGVLSIKGTTIQNFDEKESIQKNLRKPKEQLEEFSNAGKVKLRKFMENIRAVDTFFNGRINNHMIILKCI